SEFGGIQLASVVLALRGPQASEEVVEGTDAGNVARTKAAENGVKRNAVHLVDPFGDADLGTNEQENQIRSEHGSRVARIRSLGIVVREQHGGQVREVGDPQLGDERPVI